MCCSLGKTYAAQKRSCFFVIIEPVSSQTYRERGSSFLLRLSASTMCHQRKAMISLMISSNALRAEGCIPISECITGPPCRRNIGRQLFFSRLANLFIGDLRLGKALTIYRRVKPQGQHRVVWKDDAFQQGNASHGAKRIVEPAAENAVFYRPKFGPQIFTTDRDRRQVFEKWWARQGLNL
jgi:hypothetical protein